MLRMLSATFDFGQVSGPMSTQFLFGGGGGCAQLQIRLACWLSHGVMPGDEIQHRDEGKGNRGVGLG